LSISLDRIKRYQPLHFWYVQFPQGNACLGNKERGYLYRETWWITFL